MKQALNLSADQEVALRRSPERDVATGTMDIEAIIAKPVWQLSLAEIDALPDKDRGAALAQLLRTARTGELLMLAANPPGAKYEVVFDSDLGWKLQTLCVCPCDQPDFIAAYYEYRPEIEATKETLTIADFIDEATPCEMHCIGSAGQPRRWVWFCPLCDFATFDGEKSRGACALRTAISQGKEA